jgi:hypothetical protein
MKCSSATTLALALAASLAASHIARAQMPPQCNGFITLRDEAQKRGKAIGDGEKRHVEREQLCKLVTSFFAAEGSLVKFLVDNKTMCGVPDQLITNMKATHSKTSKFRAVVCAPAPKPHMPTLSDALGTPELDTSKNTRTGHGTFDTLTGNPLAR